MNLYSQKRHCFHAKFYYFRLEDIKEFQKFLKDNRNVKVTKGLILENMKKHCL